MKLNNLVDLPAHAATLARLRASLRAESTRLGDTVGWHATSDAAR